MYRITRLYFILQAEIILAIPAILMKPSVDDIQHALNKAVQTMLRTTQVGIVNHL